jgi:hypothetical protein
VGHKRFFDAGHLLRARVPRLELARATAKRKKKKESSTNKEEKNDA